MWYGLLLTISGIGAAVGGALATLIVDRIGWRRLLLAMIASCAPLLFAIGVSPNLLVLAVVLFLNSAFGVIASICMAAFRQSVVPGRLLGRVMSVGRFLTLGLVVLC